VARDEDLDLGPDPDPGTGEEDIQLGVDSRETREKILKERIREWAVYGQEEGDTGLLLPDASHVRNKLHRSIRNNHP
jgi:hypothetical protein